MYARAELRRSSFARFMACTLMRQPKCRAAPQFKTPVSAKGLPSGPSEPSGGGSPCCSTTSAKGRSVRFNRCTHDALDVLYLGRFGQPRRQCGVRGSSSVQVCTNTSHLVKRARHDSTCSSTSRKSHVRRMWPLTWMAMAPGSNPSVAAAACMRDSRAERWARAVGEVCDREAKSVNQLRITNSYQCSMQNPPSQNLAPLFHTSPSRSHFFYARPLPSHESGHGFVFWPKKGQRPERLGVLKS